MKTTIKIFLTAVCVFAISACSLEEYNPSGATADIVYNSENGITYLTNAAYYNFGAQFYGREDIVFLSEGGTDCWYMSGKGSYAAQLMSYNERLDPTVGQIKNTWQRLYEIVNYANSGIERIGNIPFSTQEAKNTKEGELRFIRAYAYWLIAETYGNVTLRTTEAKGVILTAQRSPLKDFYDLIIGDLQAAINLLPISQAEYGRAEKKAAYGLLARTALTRASYLEYFENNKTEADKYYTIALNAAKELINNQTAYKCKLYDTFEEVFLPANNKNNAETLWAVTHSTISTLNAQSGNPNRLFKWYVAKYTGLCGMPTIEVLEYGRDNNRYMMPTKYLLNVFNENIDSRYYSSFREAHILPSGSYKWTTNDIATFQKSFAAGAVSINAGDTALLYTKKAIPNKASISYGVKDINDTYNADGSISNNAANNIYYPSLRKFRDPDRNANSDAGTKNVNIIRLAEMYLIAAEASWKLGSVNDAVPYINVLRTRAAIKTPVDRTADMQVSANEINIDFILDERTRELCGEHIRWFDLKRTKQLENRLGAGKANPDITTFNPAKHYVRPVPQAELAVMENGDEYGQNPNY
ncbi:MAG: RagB/SusD family nutrient uptake outer membrane protein [Dysgonamonadaceae bacterium]|jgi:hypothetical protein|nr:RagB/SusD family nutrient uptake outer membrane protein [Dysgonamonadaceae bacterium]